MDTVTLLLIILLLVFIFGGWQWPASRPSGEPGFPLAGLLYVLAFVVLIVLVLRLLAVI